LKPTFAPGLRVSVTYWNNKLRGGVTAPTAAFVTSAPDLNYLLTIFPVAGGATAAQIATATAGLPQANPATASVYYIISNQQNNVVNLDVAGIDFDASYRLETENAGKFTFGAGFTRKLKFDAAAGSGPKFDMLGVAGIFATFQAIKFEGRASIGWDYKGFNANVSASHTGGYTNRGLGGTNLVTAVTRNAAGFAVGGGDAVKSFTSVDLNLSYTLKDVSIFKSAQFFVDATNIFDKAPPFLNAYGVNGASGYDGLNANPIGRVITIGLRTKF
jgi:iron complex outermembrane recepter protein